MPIHLNQLPGRKPYGNRVLILPLQSFPGGIAAYTACNALTAMATYTVTDSLSLKLQPKTPKSALLEFYQAQGQAQAQGIHPSQVLFNVLRTGPDHAPLFACKLELPSVGWLTPQV